jgi:hypothetical protein
MRIFWWIAAAVVAAFGITSLSRLMKTTEVANRSEFDNWVDVVLSKALGEKLHQSSEIILQAFRGSPSPELVKTIKESVRSVIVTFTRLSDNRDVQVRLDVAYKDGTSFSTSTERDWDRLPESIRAEYLRSGKEILSRPWDFPWVSS